ncbi:MAG: hypothetical protein P8Y64_09390 [Gammaproteobacteria bacterium]
MATKMYLEWAKCPTGVWCSFDQLDPATVNAKGIYLIWRNTEDGGVVRVGKGNICERIRTLRKDPAVRRYGPNLLVTWASVEPEEMDSVVRYLADHYNPLITDRLPEPPPIAVNTPD